MTFTFGDLDLFHNSVAVRHDGRSTMKAWLQSVPNERHCFQQVLFDRAWQPQKHAQSRCTWISYIHCRTTMFMGTTFLQLCLHLNDGPSFSKEPEHHAWCLIVFLANEIAHQISFQSAKFVIIMGVGSPSLMQFHFQTMH